MAVYDLKITMEDVIREVVPASFINTRRRSSDGIIITCPQCGKPKMAVSLTKNIFNCPVCDDVGGGVLDAWALFRGIVDATPRGKRRKAALDIDRYFKLSDEEKKVERRKIEAEKEFLDLKMPEPMEYEVASVVQRDRTYKALFDKLYLSDQHRESLRKRGFSDEAIDYFNFKSVPRSNLRNLASDLLNSGCSLKGIPGFYQESDGKWTLVKRSQGIMIPVVDGQGRYQTVQTRLDEGKPKYLNFSSSGRESGTRGKSFIHFANIESRDLARVIITEGCLKGDLVNYYTKIPVLAIMGVQNTKYLPDILKQMKEKGLQSIDVAFDMDFQTNPHVYRALVKLERILEDAKISYRRMLWDSEQKGLDDFLHSLEEEKK